MRILHVFSNWKWTGPAEPAVRLAAALRARHDVEFACGACPYPDLVNRVALEAERAGLPRPDGSDGLRLRKHLDPLGGARDLVRLTRLVRDRRYDVVHTHLLNDHLLAGMAARRAGDGAIVVRTVYGGPDVAARIRTRFAFRRLTDGVVAASGAAADAVRAATFFPAERSFVVPGAVDVARFSPAALAPLRAASRAEFGLADEDVALGIVARVQRHRRFELLFDAFARAVARQPALRLVVIGRGTHLDEVAHRPVHDLGLAGRVHFAGYREGEAYVRVLAALDAGIFLVPGSDGSCRAARELMAAGLPLAVTPRPPLPEIVEHGATGLVAGEQAGAFAEAFERLAGDAALRRAMGKASRARAERLFSLARQAHEIEAVYERVARLGQRRAAGRSA